MPGQGQGRGKGAPFKKGDPRVGRKPGAVNKTTVEAKAIARSLIEDPEYQAGLKARMLAGELAPAMEALLWHYGFGKPKDTVEHSGPNGGPILPGLTVILETRQAAA